MKKTFYTLLVTAGVAGFSAGAMAADDAMTYYNDGNTPAVESHDANVAPQADATGIDATQVQSVQASLRDEGYAVSVDGVWGPQTAEALRQFQTANNLTPTGQIDSDTLAALEIQQ